ncbi:MAG: hypothetical protein ACQESW_04410 [Bacteroidota bacterium]
MEDENVQQQLEELLKKTGNNFSILEEQINLDLQMTFFKELKKVSGHDKSTSLNGLVELLFEAQDPEQVKQRLMELCLYDEPEAFRALEAYLEKAQGELYDYTLLALQQCRMGLENKLLGEYQVFISTGLGGKGQSLRYFLALKSYEGHAFSTLQRDVITSEFSLRLKAHEGVCEETFFSNNYATLLILLPLATSVRQVVEEAIGKCNELGPFLSEHFLITNVKQLSWEEIESSFNKKEQPDNTSNDIV